MYIWIWLHAYPYIIIYEHICILVIHKQACPINIPNYIWTVVSSILHLNSCARCRLQRIISRNIFLVICGSGVQRINCAVSILSLAHCFRYTFAHTNQPGRCIHYETQTLRREYIKRCLFRRGGWLLYLTNICIVFSPTDRHSLYKKKHIIHRGFMPVISQEKINVYLWSPTKINWCHCLFYQKYIYIM